MQSRRLRHFLAVYAHRSLARAAEVLHVTQPALSKSLQQLEEQLGVRLFERTPCGMVPTAYGEAFAARARIVEAELQNAVRDIAELSGASAGEVTVGVTPSVAADLVPRAFRILRARRPGVRLDVREGLMEQHVPALRRGELDVIVGCRLHETHADLATEVVQQDRVEVYARAGHPLARADRVLPEALLSYPWVLPPNTQFWLAEFDRLFVARGLPTPQPEAVTNAPGFIRAMLAAGDYLTALPSRLVAVDRAAGTLAAIAVANLRVSMSVTIVSRARAAPLPAFEAFLAALREAAHGDAPRRSAVG